MKRMTWTFLACLIYPWTLAAQDELAMTPFDELPINKAEAQRVSQVFWNAQSIQDSVRQNLPESVRSKFTRGPASNGCDIQAVNKTEGSADTCELTEDPEKMGKFMYVFSLSCSFGSYQVSVCSREESKLLNQLKVTNPERMVMEEERLFDPDSTM